MIVGAQVAAVATGFVPGAGRAQFPLPRCPGQRGQQGPEAASGIQHIVYHEQSAEARDLLQQVRKAVDAHPLTLRVDARVGADPHRQVLTAMAVIAQVFMDRNGDGCTAAPDAQQQVRPVTAGVDQGAEPEAFGEQGFGTDELFGHGAVTTAGPECSAV